jgi:phosphoglycerol transferase MdoB-like AlkP superfamily enzyme
MVDHLLKTVIPRLSKSKEPFALNWNTEDTHPFPLYSRDRRCENRMKSSGNRMLQSFDCMDQNLERFIKGLMKMEIWNTTEIFLYGDHVVMRGARDITFFEPRSLVAMVPSRSHQLITKRVSIYDFGPTILDLIGLDYGPKFPFGVSIFSKKVGVVPDATHFQFIHNYFKDGMKWGDKGRCRKNKDGMGFCRDTDFGFGSQNEWKLN